MRPLILALLLPLAACGKGGDGNSSDRSRGGDAAAPLARPTGPPPKTPVMQVTPAPGNEVEWMEPRSGAGDPRSAPYGALLNRLVVDAPSQR